MTKPFHPKTKLDKKIANLTRRYVGPHASWDRVQFRKDVKSICRLAVKQGNVK